MNLRSFRKNKLKMELEDFAILIDEEPSNITEW
jgi:hypothetical protein